MFVVVFLILLEMVGYIFDIFVLNVWAVLILGSEIDIGKWVNLIII